MEIIHVPLNIKSPIRRLAAKNRKLRDIFSLQLTDAGELFWCLVKPSKASSHLVYNMCEQQTAPSEIPSDHISTSTARLCVVAKRRKKKKINKKEPFHFFVLCTVLCFPSFEKVRHRRTADYEMSRYSKREKNRFAEAGWGRTLASQQVTAKHSDCNLHIIRFSHEFIRENMVLKTFNDEELNESHGLLRLPAPTDWLMKTCVKTCVAFKYWNLLPVDSVYCLSDSLTHT